MRLGVLLLAALAVTACERGVIPPAAPGEFLITTLAAPPGRPVDRTFGFYCRWFSHAAGADYGKAFTAANVALKAEGEKTGANAFINLSVSTVSSADPKAPGALVMLCGDFARVQ